MRNNCKFFQQRDSLWIRRPLPPDLDEDDDERSANRSWKFIKIKNIVPLGIYIHEWGSFLCVSNLLWIHSNLNSEKIFLEFSKIKLYGRKICICLLVNFLVIFMTYIYIYIHEHERFVWVKTLVVTEWFLVWLNIFSFSWRS